MWYYVLFLREKKARVEGQVLWQAARLISSVLCQPPRKTLKSVMLTSCNTVTLYRHRKKRWEGGREAGKQRLRQSRRDGERGMERELLTKKKNPNIYSTRKNSRILQHLPHSRCFHPLTILKSFPVNTSIFCS